jgi:hypothetical protein
MTTLAKAGRPSKRTPATTRKILRGIAAGLPVKMAAAAAQVSVETFFRWRREVPEFDVAVEAALAKSVRHHLKVIETAASQGDWKAASWLLEHRFPEHFAKTRIELEHIGQLEHRFVVPPSIIDEIAKARRVNENDPD